MNKPVILLIIVFLLCYMSYENKENLVCKRLSNTPYYLTEDGRKLVEVPNNQRQQIANAISYQGVTGDTMGINNQGVILVTGDVIDANNQGITGDTMGINNQGVTGDVNVTGDVIDQIIKGLLVKYTKTIIKI